MYILEKLLYIPLSLKPTYEEWKSSSEVADIMWLTRLKPTYEEWKF